MDDNKRKDTSIKIKACMITQQLDYYDTQDISVIESRIKSLSFIKTYCCIIHDKDVLSDWLPKRKHFHAVLTFSNATTIGAVAKGLSVPSQCVEKIKNTTKTARLYLIHKNDIDKFQYDPKDVLANFDYVDFADDYKPQQKKESIAERIASWEIKQYNLYNYVSVDEFARHKQYYDRAFTYRRKKMKTMDRNLRCVFICWPSGCWKTTIAKRLAKEEGYKAYISSGWKNPLDDYEWEECIVLDDIRPETFDYNDLLKFTDNNTDSFVGCRFNNKSIWECKLIIITTVIPIEEFAKFWAYWNDTADQLLRRFTTYIDMDSSYIRFYSYNEYEKKYIMKTRRNNDILAVYKNNWLANEKFTIDLADKLWLSVATSDA